MTRDEIDTLVDEYGYEDILIPDGFEEAFIGLCSQFNKTFAIFDREKCLQILVKRDGMSYEDAVEFFEYNVQGAYVGETTPGFVFANKDGNLT